MSPLTAAVLSAVALGQPPTRVGTEAVITAADQLARRNKSCGPLAGYYCARRLGRDVDYAEFARTAAVEDDGVSLDDVHRLLAEAGIRSEVVRCDPGRLESLPLPAILVIRPAHCVVLDGWDAETGRARVFEPASQKVHTVPAEAIRRAWTGTAIVFDEPRISRREFAATAALAALGVVLAAARPPRSSRRRT